MRHERWSAWDAADAIGLVLPEVDRFAALSNDGPEPLRQPRTALGMCHAGPIAPAPPPRTMTVGFRYPDGAVQSVPAEEVADGEWVLYLPGGATARMSGAPGSDT